MCFRNSIARRATENVQVYMKGFNTDDTEEYVAWAFSYHGEIPFLYQTFNITNEVEPDLKKELGGYKVVSSSHVSPSNLLPHLPTDPS